MKQFIIIITTFLASTFLLTSCDDDNFLIKGQGSNVNNVRQPGSFNGISLCISATVEIHRDSIFRVELNGQQNILNVIETRVSGNRLNISLERGASIRKHNPITIKVYMPYLDYVDVSGSGDVICVDDFTSSDIQTNVSGSGNITLRGVVSNSFKATISGSGNIRHTGTGVCKRADYTVSGSGNIYTEWLKADDVDARISGSGDVWLYAEKTLNASISGSGSIMYHGTPAMTVNISGSGKVVKIQ
jgi:hypothetical protein